MTKKTTTQIEELGEFALIEHLTASNMKIRNQSTFKSIGDDAAVINCQGMMQVVTTDMLTEGVHFNLVYAPLKHLGYKSVVVNLSDVYAMNAIPKQITVSLAISGKFSVEAIEELYEGIYLACELYGVDLIGGDTSGSLTGLTISITAIGEVQKDAITYRNGASQHDLICVSGDLGAAYMGLQLLERERKIFESGGTKEHVDLTSYPYIVERQLKPEARKDIVAALHEHKIHPTAMIDISDGLSSELLHICKQSDVGCRIYQEKIPLHEETKKMAEELNIASTVSVLNGGEDYELLFTIKQTDYDLVNKIPGISVIGHITDKPKGSAIVMPDGSEVPLYAQGWNAFQEK